MVEVREHKLDQAIAFLVLSPVDRPLWVVTW